MGKTGNAYPAWIEWLFRSGVGWGNFNPPYALFRQRKDTERLTSMVGSEINGAGELREASLNELRSDDRDRVERALFYLMVVGQPQDVDAVARLVDNPSETIKKAAKTARFELRRRAGGKTA